MGAVSPLGACGLQDDLMVLLFFSILGLPRKQVLPVMEIKMFKSHVNSHGFSAFDGPLLLEDAVQSLLLREQSSREREEAWRLCYPQYSEGPGEAQRSGVTQVEREEAKTGILTF